MDNDDSDEFIAGQEITMKMTPTPEKLSIIREWSAIVPTLYMLDICVVGATKLTEKSLEEKPEKANLVAALRNLDRPNNCFSYLCALMEKVSDSRGHLSFEELKNQILADISALRGFFKEARIAEQDEFLIGFLKEIMGDPIELNRSDYLRFLERLNNHFKLKDSVSPLRRLGKAKEILLEADSLGISTQHPVVSVALACLYGNRFAKKLMKFKADSKVFDAENSLADIMLISRFAKIKLEIEHHGRNGFGYPRVEFLTDDKGLSELVKCFKPKAVKYQHMADGRESRLTMTVDLVKLLTEATEEERRAITDMVLSIDHGDDQSNH